MAYDGSAWNETAPTNDDLANEIDDMLRDIKIGVRSRMANEHAWRASQVATGSDGYHTFVSLTTQTSAPGLVYGTATQAAALYAITSGTGVATVIRNSAGYEAVLMHSSYLGGGIVPKGGIIMWSGTIATLPIGWALCDGNNGTPNLVDKFIVCAKEDDSGVAKTNVSGSLTQTGGEAAHTLTEAELPAISITIPANNSTSAPPFNKVAGSDGAGGFSGDVSANAIGSGDAHNTLPPYYALALIMKL